MKDLMIFLFIMMLICAGALYLKNQSEPLAAPRVDINSTATLLEKEVATIQKIAPPTIDPKTDPLKPVAPKGPTYIPPAVPERDNPDRIVQ